MSELVVQFGLVILIALAVVHIYSAFLKSEGWISLFVFGIVLGVAYWLSYEFHCWLQMLGVIQ